MEKQLSQKQGHCMEHMAVKMADSVFRAELIATAVEYWKEMRATSRTYVMEPKAHQDQWVIEDIGGYNGTDGLNGTNGTNGTNGEIGVSSFVSS